MRVAAGAVRAGSVQAHHRLTLRWSRRSCRMGSGVGEITELLHAARAGDAPALQEVFAAVYPTLRTLAGSRLRGMPGEYTLSPTALVHEAYLKLVGAGRLDLTDRQHFFACAARAMRHILVDHARARAALSRGGHALRVDWDGVQDTAIDTQALLDVNQALDRLDAISPALRELVELRVFAGMTLEELAEINDRSLRSINRDWQRARALLMAQMTEPDP